MNLFDTNSTERTRVLSISSPQEFLAFGLTAADSITVEIALTGKMSGSFISSGCALIEVSNQAIPIEATIPYTICGCDVLATSTSPRFVIDRPGVYVVTFNGPSFGDAVVTVDDAAQSVVNQFSQCPCPGQPTTDLVGRVVSIVFDTNGLLTLVNSDGTVLTAQIPICP